MKQTSNALIQTLKAQSNLVNKLHIEEFTFVIPRRFQNDPLEKRFAQYGQMSGGRFLVSLREVESSEKILLIRSLFKEDINFWDDDIQIKKLETKDFLQHIAHKDVELLPVIFKEDSEEFAYISGGYAAKKLMKQIKCCECRTILTGTDTETPYFQLLSRGGLITPSPILANIFCKGFTVLDVADSVIQQHPKVPARYAAEYVLGEHFNEINVGCNDRHL